MYIWEVKGNKDPGKIWRERGRARVPASFYIPDLPEGDLAVGRPRLDLRSKKKRATGPGPHKPARLPGQGPCPWACVWSTQRFQASDFERLRKIACDRQLSGRLRSNRCARTPSALSCWPACHRPLGGRPRYLRCAPAARLGVPLAAGLGTERALCRPVSFWQPRARSDSHHVPAMCHSKHTAPRFGDRTSLCVRVRVLVHKDWSSFNGLHLL